MSASDITLTNLKTALDLAATAIDADNFTEAKRKLAKARAIRAGIEDTVQSSGTLSAFDKDYERIFALLEALEADANQDDDNGRRTVFGRTNFS